EHSRFRERRRRRVEFQRHGFEPMALPFLDLCIGYSHATCGGRGRRGCGRRGSAGSAWSSPQATSQGHQDSSHPSLQLQVQSAERLKGTAEVGSAAQACAEERQ
ncbi:unnamed protein product, partial [Symbiodinium sp. CCMP2456]